MELNALDEGGVIGRLLAQHQEKISTIIAHMRTEQQEMRAEIHAMMGRPDPRNSGPSLRELYLAKREEFVKAGLAAVPPGSWTPGFPSPSVCICRPTHRLNDPICQWNPTNAAIATIAEYFEEASTVEEKIALARALRESVCVCSPTHRPDEPICQWKE